MGGHKQILLHVYVYKPRTRSKYGRNFSFGMGNLHWCALVPVKFQRDIPIIPHKNVRSKVLVGMNMAHSNMAMACLPTIEISTKSSMRVDPNSMRVHPTSRLVLKANRKVVLTASELLKARKSVIAWL